MKEIVTPEYLAALQLIANERPLSARERREYPAMRPILFRLVVARKQAGLTQTDAALGIGLSRASSLSDLETGRAEIKVRQLIALCGLYHVSPAWVIEGDLVAGNAPECDSCGSPNVWYDNGYWRCGACGFEWPDQDGAE